MLQQITEQQIINDFSKISYLSLPWKLDIVGLRVCDLLDRSQKLKSLWLRLALPCGSFSGLHFVGNLFDKKEHQEVLTSPWSRVQIGLGIHVLAERIYFTSFVLFFVIPFVS